MRLAVVALVLFAQPFLHPHLPHEPVHARIAWTTPDPNYPLKVRILSADHHNEYHSSGIVDSTSYGSGNLWSEPKVGFDYKTDCPGGFTHNAAKDEYYQGRWKKQDRKIEILTVEVGSNHPEHCEIDVTLKSAPYDKDNPPPHLVTAHD